MKQPLTGQDRIHADIIIERIRELGFRFERRRLLQRITEDASAQKIQLEGMAMAPDQLLERHDGNGMRHARPGGH